MDEVCFQSDRYDILAKMDDAWESYTAKRILGEKGS